MFSPDVIGGEVHELFLNQINRFYPIESQLTLHIKQMIEPPIGLLSVLPAWSTSLSGLSLQHSEPSRANSRIFHFRQNLRLISGSHRIVWLDNLFLRSTAEG